MIKSSTTSKDKSTVAVLDSKLHIFKIGMFEHYGMEQWGVFMDGKLVNYFMGEYAARRKMEDLQSKMTRQNMLGKKSND